MNITIYNESLARLERRIEMGFAEGFKMSMDGLESVPVDVVVSSVERCRAYCSVATIGVG